jgi:hypothetical protein
MSISRIAGALLALTFSAGCAGVNPIGASSPQGSALSSSAKAASMRRPHEGSFGELYVAAASGVMVFAMVNNALVVQRTIKNSINGPVALAFDSSNDLFVANSNDTVTEYDEGSKSPGAPINTISNGIKGPTAVGLDAHDNLWVANNTSGALTEYAPGSKSPSQTISAAINAPVAMAFNAAGTTVSVANANSVASYDVITGNRGRTITAGINAPTALSYDGSGNLFVANANAITEYAPAQTSVSQTIKTGVDNPVALTADPFDDLVYVANAGNGTLTAYDRRSGAPGTPYFKGVDLSVFTGISVVVSGPTDCSCIATGGSTAIQILWVGFQSTPSNIVMPDFEGSTSPVAMAFGP